MSVNATLPYLIYMFCALLGAVFCIFLPETLSHQLPETLSDARIFGKDQNIFGKQKQRNNNNNINDGSDKPLKS